MVSMKHTIIVLSLAVLVGACERSSEERADAATSGGDSDASDDGASHGEDATTSGDGGEEVDTRPLPSGPPVDVGAPNVPAFEPAFPEQTRAPGMKTQMPFEVVQIAAGFNKPWAIAFMPDMRMLVTEKPTGRLYIVTADGTKSPAVTGTPPVDGRGQGGLLDVELGPDYATSKRIYWTYYEPRDGGNGLAVARGILDDGAAPSVSDVEIIFRMQPTLESTLHAGGRLVFTPDGKLFVTLGERSVLEGRMQAQDLGSHFGKIVRIEPNGEVPSDNPHVNTQGARPEIWSSGHRNVLAGALDTKGRLWVAEMGPKGGDELNLVQRAKDYGWPTIGYGEEYSGEPIHEETAAAGLEQPVYYWDPVVSPSGLTIYTGTLLPEWRGDFFLGGLSSTALIRLMVRDDKVVGEERLLTDRGERIREVVQGPDGALYLLTDDANGKLLKIVPKS
jgi:glucose/arabinose dehydrogenase